MEVPLTYQMNGLTVIRAFNKIGHFERGVQAAIDDQNVRVQMPAGDRKRRRLTCIAIRDSAGKSAGTFLLHYFEEPS